MKAVGVVEELKKFTSRQVIVVVNRTTRKLIANTPRRSGWAASNWVPSLGSPAGGPFGSKKAINTAPQIAGLAAIKAYRITRTPPPVISNSVPYINKLNSGYSAKAPAFFVEAALSDAIRQTAGVSQR